VLGQGAAGSVPARLLISAAGVQSPCRGGREPTATLDAEGLPPPPGCTPGASPGRACGKARLNAEEPEGLSLLLEWPKLTRESASFKRSGSLSLARSGMGLQTPGWDCLMRLLGFCTPASSLPSPPSRLSTGLEAPDPDMPSTFITD
jgi:hypothetical protein